MLAGSLPSQSLSLSSFSRHTHTPCINVVIGGVHLYRKQPSQLSCFQPFLLSLCFSTAYVWYFTLMCVTSGDMQEAVMFTSLRQLHVTNNIVDRSINHTVIIPFKCLYSHQHCLIFLALVLNSYGCCGKHSELPQSPSKKHICLKLVISLLLTLH